jgi:hypothetical protein
MSRDVQDAPFAHRRGRPGAVWPALVGTGRHPPGIAGFDDDYASEDGVHVEVMSEE